MHPLHLDVQLDVEFDEPGRSRALARSWFEGGPAELGGDLYQRLLASAPLDESVLRTGRRFGQPGSVWASMTVYQDGDGGATHAESAVYSGENFARFLDRIGAETPAAEFVLCTLGDDGYPAHGLRLLMTRNDLDPRWVYLQAAVPEPWLDDPDYQHRTLDFLRHAAEESNPGFGHITHTYFPHRTALEAQLPGVTADESVIRSRQELRGYSWVTVCPQELGEALGGVRKLREGGAFSRVEELTRGGYWLLATDDYRDYDLVAATRVFYALAPVLIGGKPFDPADDLVDQLPYLIVIEDAALFRNPAGHPQPPGNGHIQ